MESTQTQTHSHLEGGDLQSPEMRRWLLHLKFSLLLRQRRASIGGRRPLVKRRTNRSIACLHFKVLLGLAASAYFWAQQSDTAHDSTTLPTQTSLKIRTLQSVLRQRGVSTESVLERTDLETLVARSGGSCLFFFQNVMKRFSIN